MVEKPRILAFSGSARKGSFNSQLLAIAVEAAERAGAEVTVVNLRELALPIYDNEFEASKGLPDGAKAFKAAMSTSDGFLIACPEYNSSITPLLKNAIDWASRQEEPNEPVLASFKGKMAALISASPGGLGGLRALTHLRALLQNVFVTVIPLHKCLSAAHEAFNEDGSLKDFKQQQAVENVATALVNALH